MNQSRYFVYVSSSKYLIWFGKYLAGLLQSTVSDKATAHWTITFKSSLQYLHHRNIPVIDLRDPNQDKRKLYDSVSINTSLCCLFNTDRRSVAERRHMRPPNGRRVAAPVRELGGAFYRQLKCCSKTVRETSRQRTSPPRLVLALSLGWEFEVVQWTHTI